MRERVVWVKKIANDVGDDSYISGATSPGVTLQGTLMNHSMTKASVDAHIVEYNQVKAIDSAAPPLIFGETNSLYNQGRPGLSNTFGAALWGVDFNLYSASVGFKRVHMHMGTDYRVRFHPPFPTPYSSSYSLTQFHLVLSYTLSLSFEPPNQL